MESRVQDLVIHSCTVKELWDYLEKVYSGRSNPNYAYDVIQELFRCKKGNKMLAQYYVNFNKSTKELLCFSSYLM